MKLTKSFREITGKSLQSFKNFPISLLWAFAGTGYTLWFIEQNTGADFLFQHVKIILTFVLGISWLIGFRLLFHYFKTYKNKHWWWFSLIGLFFLFVYYYQLPGDKEAFDNVVVPYRFALYLLAGHLFVSFAPFIFSWKKNAYWNYLRNLVTGFITALFFSFILYLGIGLAILAVKFLFHISLRNRIFPETFVFIAGVVNTWIFLAHLPVKQEESEIHYSKVLEGFIKYILIPLSILYIFILYTYSLQIIVLWRLPKGWVSYLVIALSALGFLIQIFINPIAKTAQSRLIRKFLPWFYYALFPLLILFFTAIGKRISAYGFTERRYLVLALALWVTGMSFYFVFSRKKQLRYIPLSLTVLILVSSFGIWGMFQISIHNQVRRFKRLYEDMQSKDFKITLEEKDNFTSIILFLQDHKSLESLTGILGYNPKTVLSDTRYWNVAERLSDTLHLQVIDFPENNRPRSFQYFRLASNQKISLQGYDYLLHYEFPPLRKTGKDAKDENPEITFNINSRNSLYLIKNKDTLHEIKLNPFLFSLHNFSDNDEMPVKRMYFIADYDDYRLKILFHRLEIIQNIHTPEKKEISNAEMSILVKEKNSVKALR